MPQNMQKKPKVARLDLDEQEAMLEADAPVTGLSMDEIENLSESDAPYVAALALLQFGNTPEKIAKQLVKDGMIERRVEAMRLALRVQKENPQEQITNANILFGVAALAFLIALALLIPSVLRSGVAGLLNPSLAFLAIAAWFAYKGYSILQKAKS